jgi:hypothetical protein
MSEPTTTLFIGGLDVHSISADDIKSLFPESLAAEVQMPEGRNGAKSRGFCLVFFDTVENASQGKSIINDSSLETGRVEFSNKHRESTSNTDVGPSDEAKAARAEKFQYCVHVTGLPFRCFSGRFNKWIVEELCVAGVTSAITVLQKDTDEDDNKVNHGYVAFATQSEADQGVDLIKDQQIQAYAPRPKTEAGEKETTEVCDTEKPVEDVNEDTIDEEKSTEEEQKMISYTVGAERFTEMPPFAPQRKRNPRPKNTNTSERRDRGNTTGRGRGRDSRNDHRGSINDRLGRPDGRRYDRGDRREYDRGGGYTNRRNDDRDFRDYRRRGERSRSRSRDRYGSGGGYGGYQRDDRGASRYDRSAYRAPTDSRARSRSRERGYDRDRGYAGNRSGDDFRGSYSTGRIGRDHSRSRSPHGYRR